MELKELVERISFIRTRANLSARKLSLSIGKGESYIHQLESTLGTENQFAPTFESLMEILEACNTTPEEFFYYSIPAYKSDKHLIDILRNLDEDKIKALTSLLKK